MSYAPVAKCHRTPSPSFRRALDSSWMIGRQALHNPLGGLGAGLNSDAIIDSFRYRPKITSNPARLLKN